MKKRIDNKNFVSKFFDDFLSVISRIFDKILNLRAKSLIKYLIELLIIFAFIALLRLPFDLLKELTSKSFNFAYPITNIIKILLSLAVEVIFIIFSILIFTYVYNKKYPDNKISSIKKNEYKEAFSSLFYAFIIVTCIPVFILELFIICGFLLSMYMIFLGVSYYGVSLIFLSLLIIGIVILWMIYNYVFNIRRNRQSQKLVLFISSLVLALGITLFSLEVVSTKIINNTLPSYDYKINDDTLRTKINDNTKVVCNNCNKEYDIIYDNTLNNEIIIEVSYHSEFVQNIFSTENKLIRIDDEYVNLTKNTEFKEMIMNDLRKKELYDYRLLFQKQLTIWINENNADELEVLIR